MNTFSFVAPEGTGYAVYLAGERVGWEPELAAAQRVYQEQFDSHYTLTVLACLRAQEFADICLDVMPCSHVRPDGSPFWTVFPPDKRVGVVEIGVWRKLPDLISILEAIMLWNDSPRHKAIMQTRISEFGLCEIENAILVLGRL